MVRRYCVVVVLLVFAECVKSADSRKLLFSPSQTTTCGSFFYNSQVNNDQAHN